MAKKTNSNILAEHAENNGSHPFDDIFDIKTLSNKPINIERLSKALVRWVFEEESMRIADFCTISGFSERSFYKLVDKHPMLREVLDFVKQVLGSRREQGALTRKFDALTTARTLGFYDIVTASEQERLAKLKEPEANKPTTINLMLNPVKETVEIKPLKVNDDIPRE